MHAEQAQATGVCALMHYMCISANLLNFYWYVHRGHAAKQVMWLSLTKVRIVLHEMLSTQS